MGHGFLEVRTDASEVAHMVMMYLSTRLLVDYLLELLDQRQAPALGSEIAGSR